MIGCCHMDDVPSLGGIFPFPALVVDFLPVGTFVGSCCHVASRQTGSRESDPAKHDRFAGVGGATFTPTKGYFLLSCNLRLCWYLPVAIVVSLWYFRECSLTVLPSLITRS